MISLNSPPSQLLPSRLYELRSHHPIVDSVGRLQDTEKNYWLVFIQVSLQAYEDHRKMCDMFHKPPSKRHVPQELKDDKGNMSLYSFYRTLFNIKYEEKANVMLLYVSPEETAEKSKIILPTLQQSIKELRFINQKLHVAVLSARSSFFHVMKDFPPKFKACK